MCSIKVYIPHAKAASNCDDSNVQTDCIESPEKVATSTQNREFLLWKKLYKDSKLLTNFCRDVTINQQMDTLLL